MTKDTPIKQDDHKRVKYHPHYDDPSDDLILVSNDGVHFRVSSHRMRRVSSAFAAMLDTSVSCQGSATHRDAAEKPIELDYNAKVVAKFCVYVNRPRTVKESIFEDKQERYTDHMSVFSLLEQFDCPYLLEDHIPDLSASARRVAKAFDVLVMASARNNVSMASTALRYIDAADLTVICQSVDVFEEHLARLQPDWAEHIRGRVLVTSEGETLFRVPPRARASWSFLAWDFSEAVSAIKRKRRSSFQDDITRTYAKRACSSPS